MSAVKTSIAGRRPRRFEDAVPGRYEVLDLDERSVLAYTLDRSGRWHRATQHGRPWPLSNAEARRAWRVIADQLILDRQVEPGRYALDDEERVTFLEVVSPGSPAGQALCLHRLRGAPGDWHRELMRRPLPIIKRILDDVYLTPLGVELNGPLGAAVRFGVEAGECARCYSPLSDPISRSRGFGPHCWTRLKT